MFESSTKAVIIGLKVHCIKFAATPLEAFGHAIYAHEKISKDS